MYNPHGLLLLTAESNRNGGNLLIPYAPLGVQKTDGECILIERKLSN